MHFYFHSPIGILKITGDENVITALEFKTTDGAETECPTGVIADFVRQLEAYFSGKSTAFTIPFKFTGTDFQQRIWKMVADIPFGKTVSYLDISIAAGDRNLIRAVGGANGANKLPILIPCHRVIGTSGKLTGYAGGLWRKKWLLDFEMRKTQPELFNECCQSSDKSIIYPITTTNNQLSANLEKI